MCAQNATVLEIENSVQTSKGGVGAWAPAVKDESLAIADRIRTRQHSRAAVKLTDLYTMRLEQFTTIEISPSLVGGGAPQLDLKGGAAFIFSREPNGEMGIKTPAANGALRGTQLFVNVAPGGRSFFQVLEGRVELSNPHGRLLLNAGEAGDAAPGQAPKRTAVIEARNLLQWALYYPAVLDVDELHLAAGEEASVARSVAAYRSGDLLGALEQYPNHIPSDAGGKVYRAGVLLAVGRVEEARAMLALIPESTPGRRALERMIAAVQFREMDEPQALPATVSEAIAESYYEQSRSRLEEARSAARRATVLGPRNGYAWTRLAELEFSFGRTSAANAALDRGLQFAPRNAQTHALRGFILSAQNRIGAAHEEFDRAIDLDGALGNGWLGRGLTEIKRGDRVAGRVDLQTAATVEPTVSFYHSYLGKALSAEGRKVEARKDLDLARQLDPNDPTPLLYSAIENERNNRTNEAIADLDESIHLNDNRRVYRSRFLLDQDRAVRSANLAKIYQNAGMEAVAVREATRAVEDDYASASAHMFLANAFDALRDPKRINLRYESAWSNELLLANLLASVGGGPLSQFVSQQEYSKLLDADGFGASTDTEYRDTGEVRTANSVFGTFGNVSFGVDALHYYNNGDRPNNQDSRDEVYGQFKVQVTPDDDFYFLGKWQNERAGDNFQTYNNQPLEPRFHIVEKQEPGLLLGGWNHRWEPGANTLLLGGRLADSQVLTDPASHQLLVQRDGTALRPGFIDTGASGFDQFTAPALNTAMPPPVSLGADNQSLVYSPALLRALAPFIGAGGIVGSTTAPFTFFTARKFEIYTGEMEHIWETGWNTLLIGGRWQDGTFTTDTSLSLVRPSFAGGFSTPAVQQHSEVDFDRKSLYAYDYVKAGPWLTLIGGASWDRIEHPDNFRNPPVNDQERTVQRASPKAGFTFAPSRWFTLRGAYTEGLGGVSFDESVRLEPVQVAGFNQAFRTIISESLAGSVETPLYKSWGLSAEGSLPTRTWWGAAVNVIDEDVNRTLGDFTGYNAGVFPVGPAYFASGTPQQLAYREGVFTATLNQLVGKEFALGVGYRETEAQLRSTFTELAAARASGSDLKDKARLQELTFYGNWNSQTGLFARAEANWYSQTLGDDPRGLVAGAKPRGGDDFWQFNVLAGYRFYGNQCEVSAGVLNVCDMDYRLSPLTAHDDYPRVRTFIVRCRLAF